MFKRLKFDGNEIHVPLVDPDHLVGILKKIVDQNSQILEAILGASFTEKCFDNVSAGKGSDREVD